MGSWVGHIISASPLFCVAWFSLRSCILFCKGRCCGVFWVFTSTSILVISSGTSRFSGFVCIPSFLSWLGGKTCHGWLITSCTGAYGWVGWEASHPHIFLWLGGFVFCQPLHCCSKSGTTTGSQYGQRLAALSLLGRLVVGYLYGRFIYYGVYAVRMFIHAHTWHYRCKRWGDQWKFLQATTGGPISPVLCSSDGSFVSPTDACTPHPVWDAGHLSPNSLPSFLLHCSPAFVMDSLTAPTINVNGMWEK